MAALTGVRFRTESTPATDSTSDLNMVGNLANNTSVTSVVVDDGTDFTAGQNIKMNSEEMHISSISSNTLTVVRAVNGTSVGTHNDNVSIFEDTSPTYSPSRNPDMNVDFNTDYKGITVTQAYGGKIYTNERYGKQLAWELRYTNLISADRDILEALWNAVKGRKTSFYFSPDSGTTFYNVRFKEEELTFTQTAYNIYSTTIGLIQEVS
tara:strand:+ start:13658 stop:14284 length:627 start_codon:yes stop_codon:yes gene_type:complete